MFMVSDMTIGSLLYTLVAVVKTTDGRVQERALQVYRDLRRETDWQLYMMLEPDIHKGEPVLLQIVRFAQYEFEALEPPNFDTSDDFLPGEQGKAA